MHRQAYDRNFLRKGAVVDEHLAISLETSIVNKLFGEGKAGL